MFVSFGFSKAFEAAASRSQLRERSSPCPGSQFLPASKAISKSKTLRDWKKNNSLRTYLKATCLEDHDNVFHVTSFAARPFCFCSRVCSVLFRSNVLQVVGFALQVTVSSAMGSRLSKTPAN